jgi:hypothetical protein
VAPTLMDDIREIIHPHLLEIHLILKILMRAEEVDIVDSSREKTEMMMI